VIIGEKGEDVITNRAGLVEVVTAGVCPWSLPVVSDFFQ
jgi:hypothetical protein